MIRTKLNPKSPATLTDPLRRYVFVMSINRIADIVTGQLITREVFNATNYGLAPCGANGEKSAFAIWMNAGAQRTDEISYSPGSELIYFDRDQSVYNTWRAGMENSHPLPVKEEEIAPWLNHVRYILQDRTAARMFLDWCAYLVQKPGAKVNWAYVLVGPQGCGKDLMLRPLYGILGKQNYQAITARDLEDNFTDWAESQLIIVEELPSYKKRDVYDGLKRYVAAGVPYFRVNKKGIAQYKVRNIQNWFIMSNHDDALALEHDDRRYYIYRTLATQKRAGYYAPLVSLFNDAEFQRKILSWLCDRDLSGFDPGAPPPMTEAKREMIAAARNALDLRLDDEFDEDGRYHGRELVQVSEISNHLRLALRGGDFDGKISDHRIGTWLRKAGWTQLPRLRGETKFLRLWASPNAPFATLAELSGKDLEARFREDVRRSIAGAGAGDEDVF